MTVAAGRPSHEEASDSGPVTGVGRLYRHACDQGEASGCTRLGLLMVSGRGVERDDEAAVDLFRTGCAGEDLRGDHRQRAAVGAHEAGLQ